MNGDAVGPCICFFFLSLSNLQHYVCAVKCKLNRLGCARSKKVEFRRRWIRFFSFSSFFSSLVRNSGNRILLSTLAATVATVFCCQKKTKRSRRRKHIRITYVYFFFFLSFLFGSVAIVWLIVVKYNVDDVYV